MAHRTIAPFNESRVQHVNLVAGACESHIEQPATLAQLLWTQFSPWQTPIVETDHNDHVVLASLSGMKCQQVQVIRRTITSAQTRNVQRSQRATFGKRRRHAIQLFLLIGKRRFSNQQTIQDAVAQ